RLSLVTTLKDNAEMMRAMWVVGPGDVWFAGGGEGVHHFDGQTIEAVSDGRTQSSPYSGYRAIAALGPGYAYAVGDYGLITLFDGPTWKPVRAGSTTSFYSAWAGGGRVIVGGARGVILRRD